MARRFWQICSGIKDATPGSISFTQRWGSALNLNIHQHIICLDGVYTRVNCKAVFHNVGAITDEQVATLIENISKRIVRHLRKKEYLDQEGEIVNNPMPDPLFNDHESLSQAIACSIGGKIAFGPNAGKYVTRLGKWFGYGEEIPLAKGKRCYSINGFSLHANTAINTLQRDRLEKLIEYIARGPLSNEPLEITTDKKVILRLKTPYSDGTSHLLFTFSEFIEKLVALVPPPKSHLVRWAGVLAPNSPYRQEITLKPKIKKGFQFHDDQFRDDQGHSEKPKNMSWSKLLAKVFKIDVTTCEDCGGKMETSYVCAVTDSDSITRYLKHIGINHEPPARAPPMFRPDGQFAAQCTYFSEEASEDLSQ